MSRAGFTLSRLRLIGPGARPAELRFGPGLNVVSGASNTGKSYVVQCLNYMMGAQRPPKPVPEGKGYTTALLELRSATGSVAVLERSLGKGGHFRCYLTDLDQWHDRLPSSKLAWKHNPKSEANVSRLLLALCELEGIMVRINAAGKVRPLSFRDLCRFLLVDETRILSDWSPVHASGQLPKKTEDASVFDFLISGEDARRVVEQADVKLQKARWKAKVELYDRLIADLEAELGGAGEGLVERLATVDARIDRTTSAIAGASRAVETSARARTEAWGELQAVQSRRDSIDQLLARFEGLGLNAAGSQGTLFMQADPGGTARELDPLDGVRSEMTSLAGERAELSSRMRECQRRIDAVEVDREERGEESFETNKAELSRLLEERRVLLVAQATRARIDDLVARRAALGAEPKRRVRAAKAEPSSAEAESRRAFCQQVDEILARWKFPHTGRGEVELGPGIERDLVIAGVARHTQGKGHRAILHAAFSLALMRRAGARHPGFLILDSPLTSYKEKDNYEVDEDIQRAFYMDLGAAPATEQILIFENKDPPPGLASRVSCVHLSGRPGAGRAGFF